MLQFLESDLAVSPELSGNSLDRVPPRFEQVPALSTTV
jgi:hypothetical protein